MKHKLFQLHNYINMRADRRSKGKDVKDLNQSIAKSKRYVPPVPYFEGSFEEFKKANNIQ